MKMTCMINYVSKHKHSMISLIFSVLTSGRKIWAKSKLWTIKTINSNKNKNKNNNNNNNNDKEIWVNILCKKIKGKG